MKNLKLLSLKIDDMSIDFKDGRNYIYGRNGTGKTTIFSCIKSVLGLTSLKYNIVFNQIELAILIGNSKYLFKQLKSDKYITITTSTDFIKILPNSSELNDFYCQAFIPNYIFSTESESMLKLLEFCFLTESLSTERKKQWEMINMILGINVNLLNYVKKDISLLKKHTSKNKNIEYIINEFVDGLDIKSKDISIFENIQKQKEPLYHKSRVNERLLFDATLKFDTIENESNQIRKEKLIILSEVFNSMLLQVDIHKELIKGIEDLIKDRNRSLSYGEEILSRFILILSIAKLSKEEEYNFPQLLINDSYLSGGLDKNRYDMSEVLLGNLLNDNNELQYIEFTSKEIVNNKDVVCMLDNRSGLYAR